MTNQEPIKIIIEDETPYKPENKQTNPRSVVNDAGQKITGAAKQSAQTVWNSDTRRKITQQLNESLNTAVTKGSKAISTKVAETTEQTVREQTAAVQSKLQDVDWTHEAKSGISAGLKWLSTQLTDLSERVVEKNETPKTKSPSDKDQTG
ncbi:MAG: hypothetical protein KDE48_10075 [Anaerolineales bacterium]|nr:hypothetical protein [Anaerolineales bacterium]